MTEEEKQANAIKVAEEKAQNTNKMLSTLLAENVFAKAGFKESDYKDIIPKIVIGDAESTKALAEDICKTMLDQKKNIEKEFQKKLVEQQQKPDHGDGEPDKAKDVENYEKLLADAIEKGDGVAQVYYTRLIQESKQNNN